MQLIRAAVTGVQKGEITECGCPVEWSLYFWDAIVGEFGVFDSRSSHFHI